VREEEPQTLKVSASVGGATKELSSSKSNRNKPGAERFAILERDALTFGPVTPASLQLEGLARTERKVAEDVAHVLGVYAVHDGPGVPQPYSLRFGAARTGLSHITVGRALRELVDCGVLACHGETEPRQGWEHGTKLYAVGGLEAAPVEVEGATFEPVDVAVQEPGMRFADVVPAAGTQPGAAATGDGAVTADVERQLQLSGFVHGRDDTPGVGSQCAVLDDL
jgi:hypothetical protein